MKIFQRINDFTVDKYISLGSNQQKKFFVLLHSFFVSDFNKIFSITNKIVNHPFEEMETLKSTAKDIEDYDDSIDHIFSDILYSRSIDLVSAYIFIFCKYDFPLLINDFRKRFDKMTIDEFEHLESGKIEKRIRQQIFNNILAIYEPPYRNYWQEIDGEPIRDNVNQMKIKQLAQSYREIAESYSIDEQNLHSYTNKLYEDYYGGGNSNKEYFLFGLSYVLSPAQSSHLDDALNRKLDAGYLRADQIKLFIGGIREWDDDSTIKNEFISFERWDSIIKNLILLHLQLNILNELKNAFKYANVFQSHVKASKPKELVTKFSLKIMFNRSRMSTKILSRYLRSVCIPDEIARISDEIDKDGLFKNASILSALKTQQKEGIIFDPDPF